MKGCSAIFRHAIRVIGYDSDVLIPALSRETGGGQLKDYGLQRHRLRALLRQPTHHERSDTLILSIKHYSTEEPIGRALPSLSGEVVFLPGTSVMPSKPGNKVSSRVDSSKLLRDR